MKIFFFRKGFLNMHNLTKRHISQAWKRYLKQKIKSFPSVLLYLCFAFIIRRNPRRLCSAGDLRPGQKVGISFWFPNCLLAQNSSRKKKFQLQTQYCNFEWLSCMCDLFSFQWFFPWLGEKNKRNRCAPS